MKNGGEDTASIRRLRCPTPRATHVPAPVVVAHPPRASRPGIPNSRHKATAAGVGRAVRVHGDPTERRRPRARADARSPLLRVFQAHGTGTVARKLPCNPAAALSP